MDVQHLRDKKSATAHRLERLLKAGWLLLLLLSWQVASALPPVWTDDSYPQAAAPANRRGPNMTYAKAAFKPQQALSLGKLEDDGGAASGNYSFSLPILAFPGRGHPLSLSMHFSSQVWSDTGNGKLVFDADGDWPAAGWALGFGKLVTTSNLFAGNTQFRGGLLIGANQSRQSLVPVQNETGSQRHLKIPGDSLTQIEVCCYDGQGTNEGTQAILTNGNGTAITYVNYEPGKKDSVYYPVRLTDANGNFTTIKYVVRAGRFLPPKIDSIVDTVGRTVKFYYDTADRLVTITAPGLDAQEIVYARFIYWQDRAVDVFTESGNGCKPFHTTFDHLSGVIFPATRHGFWLPSSSSYGTSTWFWQATGVEFQAQGFDTQATVTKQGSEASRSVFGYPSLSTTDCIDKPPAYSMRTDTWRDDVSGDMKTAVTKYSRPDTADDTVMVVVNPDSSSTRQYVARSADTAKGLQVGQVRRIENLDASGVVLSSTDFEWDLVKALDYAPRQRAIVQNIDPMTRGKRTTFGYDTGYPSLAVSRQFYGYSDGQTAAPLEHSESTTFVREADVVGARLLALPETVVHATASFNERTVRKFEYDKKPLTAVGEIGQHLITYEPHNEEVCVEWDYTRPGHRICVGWGEKPAKIVTIRGNVTKVTDFADAANLASPVSSSFEYDTTGNVVRSFDDLGAGTQATYGAEYQFSLPTKVVSGSLDPASSLRATSSMDYYFGSGSLKSVRNPDGGLTSYTYSQADFGWRVSSTTSPDRTSSQWTYDDDLLTTIVASQDAAGAVVESTKAERDGRGNTRRLSGDRGGPFKAETKYDSVGRIASRSNPYWKEPPIWTTREYDGLGRPTKVTTPGNAVPTTYVYDTLPSPTVVPPAPLAGNTTLSIDPWGRRRWIQTDSSGNLKYAVETVASLSIEPPSLNVLTQYEHDVFGRLRAITAGAQTRMFSYDDLGRLVGQALPERQATLDATGAYGGQSGTLRYSDVYQYDARSNLVTSIDARGVRTRFDYANDPLNRLHGISYDVPSVHDNSSPIQPVAPVTFTYKTTGSPTRIERIDSGNLAVVFDYDDQGRLLTQTSTYASHPQQPFKFQLSYDSFGRPASLTYPARYDAAGSAGLRRTVGTTYERNMPSQVTIEGLAIISPVVYGPGGVLSSMTIAFPTGPVTESFELDTTTGMPSAHKVVDASGKLLYGLTFNYIRSDTSPNNGISGQLASVRNLVKPALSQNYIYDPAGRLGQSVTGDMGATSYDVNALYQSYSYDRYGNRSAVEAFRVAANPCGVSGTPACNFTTAGDLERDGAATLAYDEKTNRMTGPNFSYDVSGNLIRATFMRRGVMQSNAIIYDAAGRIANVSDSNGKVLEAYEYGADRRRVRSVYYPGIPLRNPREVYSNWLGNSVLSESTANLVVGPAEPIRWLKDNIQAGGQRRFSETSAGRSFYINEGGTVAELTPGSGTDALKHRASRPFGTESEVPTGGEDDERFTTYKRSQTTGFDYAVNRFYSAELGRFLQTDPSGLSDGENPYSNSLNEFAYVANDPIGNVDPSGLRYVTTVHAQRYRLKLQDLHAYFDQLSGGGYGGGGRPGAGGGGSSKITIAYTSPSCMAQTFKERFIQDDKITTDVLIHSPWRTAISLGAGIGPALASEGVGMSLISGAADVAFFAGKGVGLGAIVEVAAPVVLNVAVGTVLTAGALRIGGWVGSAIDAYEATEAAANTTCLTPLR